MIEEIIIKDIKELDNNIINGFLIKVIDKEKQIFEFKSVIYSFSNSIVGDISLFESLNIGTIKILQKASLSDLSSIAIEERCKFIIDSDGLIKYIPHGVSRPRRVDHIIKKYNLYY